jgi:hypothetical protein
MEEFTVKLDSVRECSKFKRVLYIITLQPSTQPQLILNKEYCAFSPPKEIIYNFNYLPLDETTPPSKIQSFLDIHGNQLNNPCNELLIYTIKMSLSVVETVLNLFQKYKLKKTVYFFPSKFFSSDLDKYLTHYKITIFTAMSILGKVGSTGKLSNGMEMIHYKDTIKGSSLLTCQPWFRKFLSRVFSCGANRLMQIAGTCYLNAVINSIVLSPVVLNLFLKHMNEFANVFPDSKVYISSPLDIKDMTSCRRFGGKNSEEIQFIYHILYNLVCKKLRPFPRVEYKNREDYFIQASKDYFSAHTSGTGGNPLKTILLILQGTNIKFQVAQEINKTLQYFKDDLPAKLDEETELIIYRPEHEICNEDILDYLRFEKQFYPQAGIITLASLSGGFHMVVGFFCDDVPKIYDSAYNEIFEINWLLNDPSTFYESWSKLSSNAIKKDNKWVPFVILTKSDPFFQIKNEDYCFKEVLYDKKACSRENTWDVPLSRLVRVDGLTNYFADLIHCGTPGIPQDLFDLLSPFAKFFYSDKEDLTPTIELILQKYPDVDFYNYPLVALAFKKDIPGERLIFKNAPFDYLYKKYPTIDWETYDLQKIIKKYPNGEIPYKEIKYFYDNWSDLLRKKLISYGKYELYKLFRKSDPIRFKIPFSELFRTYTFLKYLKDYNLSKEDVYASNPNINDLLYNFFMSSSNDGQDLLKFGFVFDLQWVDKYSLKYDINFADINDIKYYIDTLKIPVSKLKRMKFIANVMEKQLKYLKDDEDKKYLESIGFL